ncbi:hypothetical protein B0H14DRAFT_2769382 [Mycena olivaceomarginata]|nr:hypothetical protein B0H14DRAFT_2769382 [Mycena olivaceomarginata]
MLGDRRFRDLISPSCPSIQKTKSKTPTCRVCHQRKVFLGSVCDGLNPCGSCTRARKPLVCEYFDPSARENTELPKGARAYSNTRRSATGLGHAVTCKNSSHSDACEYREQGSLREPRHERIVRTDRIVPIELSDPPPSVAISAPVESTNTSADGTLTQTDPCLDSIANTTTIYDSDGCDKPPALPVMPGSEDDLATELSTVRSLFLHQAWYYGLNLNLEKRAAIACGDYSGSVIHPVFIPVSQLIGYVLASQDQSERFAYLRGHWPEREAGQCDLTPVPDPLTNIQVYNLLALYSARRNDVRGLNEFLGTRLGLDDSSPVVPTVGEGLPQGVLQEGRSALAQLVYLDVAIKVIRNHPPLMPSVMLAKFRRPGKIELNFVRARCILILADSDSWSASSMVGSAWGERWIKLVTCIQLQLGVLNTARSPGRSPTHRVPLLLLRSCTIVKHAEIIQTIADLSSTLDPADHQYFDCTLETCWEVASREIPESLLIETLCHRKQPDFNVGRASAVPFAAAYTAIDGIY